MSTEITRPSCQHKRRAQGIFFGWWTVLASNIMSIWPHSLFVYGYGVFFKPLIEEFGWSRAVVSGAASLGKLEGGLEGPVAGILTDRYGPRLLCFLGCLIAGIGLLLMTGVNSVVSFYVFWTIAATGNNLGLSRPIFKAVTDWFVKKRGLAIALCKVGLAIGGSVVAIFLTFLVFSYGWRNAYFICGLMTFAIALPLSWFFLKPHRPEYYGLLPDGADVEDVAGDSSLKAGVEYAKEIGEVEFTAREAFHTWAFWLTAAIFGIRGMVTSVVNVHTIPFLTDVGMDPMAAAEGLGLLVGISIPGRIVGGIIADRCGMERLRYLFMLGLVGICGSFLILFNAGNNVVLLYAYLLVYGFAGLGLCSTVMPIMKARYFGRKAFSTIDGTQVLIDSAAGIAAPVYAGWVYDVTKSYTNAFVTLFAFLILSVILAFFSKPPLHGAA